MITSGKLKNYLKTIIEEREGEEYPEPYQRAGPQAAAGEISDAEIKSLFSLTVSGP